jgi:hypothetical protein
VEVVGQVGLLGAFPIAPNRGRVFTMAVGQDAAGD